MFCEKDVSGGEVSHGSQPLCGGRDMAKDSRAGALGARPHYV